MSTPSIDMRRAITLLVLLAVAGTLAWGVQARLAELRQSDDVQRAGNEAVPVEVGPAERGPITLRRTFSGTLEAAAEFVVSPKVAGRLESIDVDLGDTVTRGQVVAWLDDAELVEEVKQAQADMAVARAEQAEGGSALEIARRALDRIQSLRAEDVISESELDTMKAQELAARAHVEVANASVTRAEAALERARIRLGYARVRADWSGGDDERVVGMRFVDEGGTVSTSTALLSIVELDPLTGVVSVPERDYAHVRVGQRASLTTDTYAGVVFPGRVSRISPVFRTSTRQARVELEVVNEDERLKPGLFVRATLELDRIEDAVTVPLTALTERDGRTGVFLVEDGQARWRAVEVGVREGARIQVLGAELSGHVVTIGQELCDDGSPVTVVDESGAPGMERMAGRAATSDTSAALPDAR